MVNEELLTYNVYSTERIYRDETLCSFYFKPNRKIIKNFSPMCFFLFYSVECYYCQVNTFAKNSGKPRVFFAKCVSDTSWKYSLFARLIWKCGKNGFARINVFTTVPH